MEDEAKNHKRGKYPRAKKSTAQKKFPAGAQLFQLNSQRQQPFNLLTYYHKIQFICFYIKHCGSARFVGYVECVIHEILLHIATVTYNEHHLLPTHFCCQQIHSPWRRGVERDNTLRLNKCCRGDGPMIHSTGGGNQVEAST